MIFEGCILEYFPGQIRGNGLIEGQAMALLLGQFIQALRFCPVGLAALEITIAANPLKLGSAVRHINVVLFQR